jgi:4-oxalocrotonate tautomerase
MRKKITKKSLLTYRGIQMPVVTIRMSKGRTTDQKRRLAQGIPEAIVSVLDVDPDWVTVLIEELDKENIARAGTLLSES